MTAAALAAWVYVLQWWMAVLALVCMGLSIRDLIVAIQKRRKGQCDD